MENSDSAPSLRTLPSCLGSVLAPFEYACGGRLRGSFPGSPSRSGRAGRYGSRSCDLALALGKQIDRFAGVPSPNLVVRPVLLVETGDPPNDDQFYSALSQISRIREIRVRRLR